jgi:muconolactone delta-isomerase
MFEQGVTGMAVYLVERDLPGVTMEQLAAAQKTAIQMGKELTAEGRQVRYIRSTFVPGEHKCMCLFEASNADHVREANERGNIPFTRIVPVEDLTPTDQ